MRAKGFTSVAAVVVALHSAVLGFMFGPVAWQYLLVAVISGALIWGVGWVLMSQRRWAGLFVGMVVALAVQQIAFRWWRGQFAGAWLPLVQFAALHVLIGLGLSRWRRPWH